MSTITAREFELLRDYIEKETSISLSEDKVYLVETRLREIMRAEGIDGYLALHEQLVSGKHKALNAKVLDAMTTNETLWFRDSLPFEAFRDHLLPAYAREIEEGKRKKIRIWSAACSTGQEPYSMAMTFLDAVNLHPALQPGQLEILATDYSDEAITKATSGIYGGMAMSRGMPEGYKEKYFTAQGSNYEVNRELRQRIAFRKFNLQDSFVMMGSFDIILTRYVLIYFTDDFKREVLRKAHGALASGGVLFVGSSESLPEGAQGFSMIRSGRATYYQKRGETGGLGSIVKPVLSAPTPPSPAPKPNLSTQASPPPPAPLASRPKSRVKTTSERKSNTESLEKATEDLAEIVKRLQEMNSKYCS